MASLRRRLRAVWRFIRWSDAVHHKPKGVWVDDPLYCAMRGEDTE